MDTYLEKVVMPDTSFKIFSDISTSSDRVIEVHPHWHPEIEVLYCVKGEARQQVNDSFFVMRQGDLVIINKDQIHSTYSHNGSNCEILVVLFDVSLLFDRECNGQAIYDNATIVKNPVNLPGESGSMIYNCMTGIYKELLNKEEGYQYFVRSYINTLTGIIKRQKLYDVCQTDQKSDLMVKQMLKNTFNLIDESYFSDIGLSQAAAASNLSIPHFCRLFKKATGMTFNDYLMFYRVNRAEKLLNSSRKLTEIALECGFGSISSFTRNFKRIKMCTPSEYKRRLQLAAIDKEI